MRWAIAYLAAIFNFGSAVLASAATPNQPPFFAGKAVTITVATGAGGGYDAYTRLLARHLSQHIPGNPAIVIQYTPGAGGLIAANNLYNSAHRDGTALAMLQSSSLLVGALGDRNAKFDNLKFSLVGNMNQEVDTCSVWNTTDIRDAKTFLTQHVILGVAGAGSNSQTFPMAMADVLGANFKMVAGYDGGANLRVLAMERGELQASCGIFVSTIQAEFQPLIDQGKLRVILQMGLAKHPSFPDVPNALDLAKEGEDREALALQFSQLALGRPIIGPPDVPRPQLDALSKAFSETMEDPQFQNEAMQLKLETRWMGGGDMSAVIKEMSSASETTKERVRKQLGIER
jgi:tripartite-type tricarboxylate transporter receptor subunit TctC